MDRTYAWANSESRCNQAREKMGDPPTDGLLGGDVLSAYAARIDYLGPRLYLRPPGPIGF